MKQKIKSLFTLMEPYRKSILLVALGLGLIFTSLIFRPSQVPQKHKSETTPIAKIEELYGLAYLIQGNKSLPLKNNQQIYRHDIIKTPLNSKIELLLQNGEVLNVMEGTTLSLDKNMEQLFIIVKEGKVEPVNSIQTRHPALVITHSLRRPLREFETLTPKPQPPNQTTALQKIDVDAQKSPRPETKRASLNKQGLSPDYIQSVFESHKSNLLRCYARLAQNQPQTQGDLQIKIFIENSGRIQKTEIYNTAINDKDFLSCIETTTQRIQFKSFAGKSLQALLPLRFE